MADATPEPRVSHDATCRHGNPLHQDCFKCEESTEAVADKWRQVASDARATIAERDREVERLTTETVGARIALKDALETVADQDRQLMLFEVIKAESLERREKWEAAEARVRVLEEALRHAWEILQGMAVQDLPEDHPDRTLMNSLNTAADTWPILYGPIRAALSDMPKEEPRG